MATGGKPSKRSPKCKWGHTCASAPLGDRPKSLLQRLWRVPQFNRSSRLRSWDLKMTPMVRSSQGAPPVVL